ncbi:MAG: hypothetical protein KGP28_11180, partial [Bdellovibrionales bacterium]|nr:hypothetical protein [Bdellovibrionales bacterium]
MRKKGMISEKKALLSLLFFSVGFSGAHASAAGGAAPKPAKSSASAVSTESKKVRSRWRRSFGIGFTNLNYSQTGVVAFTQKFITVKGGLETPISGSRWSVGGSFFLNAIELANTGPYRLRFLGLNLRFGRFLT